ncbi:MAG TPA: HD domain-containing phosphohydrolase [Sphingomicrobium sp.]|nr:HD domain-containing phosphohydrolase [Sphingomicrobium sp.]
MLHQVIRAGTVRRAELLAAFSYALDITEGQPEGHSIRCCFIGQRLGAAIGLSRAELAQLYYTVLLKDLGCSSNAARICELYEADDRAFKQGYKTVGTSLAATLHFVFSRTARGRPLHRRAAAIGNILANGSRIVDEMIRSRCTRGSDIARALRFPEAVCSGIYSLDEHWDGSGRPSGIKGDAIPVYSRIALLAQVVDVFHAHAGADAAVDEVQRRSGQWFDPQLAAAFATIARDTAFWIALESPLLHARVLAAAPADEDILVDDDYLDTIAAAFGQVIDAKSPFTAGHSARVAELAAALGEQMNLGPERVRWLRRAAFLHDVGKLGVSSTILEKPSRLDDDEWVEMRKHAEHTRAILGRIQAFEDIANIAAAHHERLDGGGYPRSLAGMEIAQETRIITACDFYDALTADRPYRSALPVLGALEIMEGSVGTALDPECFEILRRVVITQS